MSAMIQMNLRLFDTQTTLLNAPGNDLSPEMKTYYDKNLLQEASPNLVHDQFGQKRPIPEGSGPKAHHRGRNTAGQQAQCQLHYGHGRPVW